MKKSRPHIILVFLLLISLSVLLNTEANAQCAMCKAIAESGGDASGKQVGTGINEGILYLMAVPYIVLFLLFRKKIIGLIRQVAAAKR